MLPRFENCKEFDYFRILLIELRNKKTKLDVEFELCRKAANEDGVITEYIFYTELKLKAYTHLLHDIDTHIACFNRRQSQYTDKTDEFQLAIELASSIMHNMIANIHALIHYRDVVKPTVMTVLGPMIMAGAAFFTAPTAAPAVAIAAFFATCKTVISLGFTRIANYAGFAQSFALIAKVTDSLGLALAELRPHASLSSDLNLTACYNRLGIEETASPGQIDARIEILMNKLKIKLSNHVKTYDSSEEWQNKSNVLADKMVGIMRAGNFANVNALQHQTKQRRLNYNS